MPPKPGDAHAILRLQRAAGNAAVSSRLDSLQRWTNPLYTTKTDEQLIRDGVDKHDLTAIRSVKNFDATHSETDKVTMIGHLVGEAWIVSDALVRLWQSFDESTLTRLVATRGDLWAKSVKKDSDLKSTIPVVRELFKKFPDEVRSTANSYLSANLQVVRQEQIDLGLLTFENGNSPEPMTPDRTRKIEQMQAASAAVAALQTAQEAARHIRVGWSSEPAKGEPGLDLVWTEEEFSPYRPPQQEEQPPGYGHQPRTPHQPYTAVKGKYDDASAKIAHLIEAFPALYAVSRLDSSEQSSKFAKIKDPATARKALGRGLDGLVSDIKGAQKQLQPGGQLDPLDLVPVHRRLTSGAKSEGGSTVTDWKSPLASWVAEEAAKDHDFDTALKALALDLAIQASFLLAPFTGGASMLFVALGAAAQAGKTAMAVDKAEALAQAARTSVTPNTELVTGAQVDTAQMTADAERVALALAALAVGAEGVSATIRAMSAGVKSSGTPGTADVQVKTLTSGQGVKPIELGAEVGGPLQPNAPDFAARRTAWTERGIRVDAIEPPPVPAEPMVIEPTAHPRVGEVSTFDAPVPMESMQETLARLGADFKRPEGAPPPLPFKRTANQRGWLLSRVDELNIIQFDPKINPKAEWRSAYRFSPPAGGGTVKFGPRLYVFDEAGNLVQASTTELTVGVRDKVMYASAPGTGAAAGRDYGHLLGIDFGHIDAQLGRHGGVAMKSNINRPTTGATAPWYDAERTAMDRALQLKQAGQPYQIVGEARGYDAAGVPAETRLRVESAGNTVFDSGWIDNR